jgi:hypothetical protein
LPEDIPAHKIIDLRKHEKRAFIWDFTTDRRRLPCRIGEIWGETREIKVLVA